MNINEERIVTDIILKLFESAYHNTWKWFTTVSKKNDILGFAAKRYGEKIVKHYNYVRVFGMKESVPLDSLFVKVNILEEIPSRKFSKVDDLENIFDKDKRSFGLSTIKSKPGLEIVNDFDKIILLGKPGAGKSTFLKHVVIKSVKKDDGLNFKSIPIFISLKTWADKDENLFDFLLDQFDICNLPDVKLFLISLLKKGKCILLLDGLDEVQESKSDYIIQQIIDFSDKFDKNKFIISCRIAAYNHWFDKFKDVEIADFDKDQIKGFITNWYRNEPKIGAECWNKISLNVQLIELARIPLLLTLLCIAYDENYDFDSNRSYLYQNAVEALLRKWDSTRRIKRNNPYASLNTEKKLSLFSNIAAKTFVKNKYFINEIGLINLIKKFIENIPLFEKENLDIESNIILKTLEEQHGILIQRARNIYSFSHLTIQEYFTARYIVNHQGKGTIEELVKNHSTDYRWIEVFQIVAGLLDDSDYLFLLMKKYFNNQLEDNPRAFKFFYDLVKEINHKFHDIPTMLSLQIVSLNIEEYNSNIINGVIKEIENNPYLIKGTSVFEEFKKNPGIHRLLDAINDSEFIKVSPIIKINTEYANKNFPNVFNFYKLIFKCLRTECYVSKQIRREMIFNLLD